jgi:glycosyltransferase involved in cell wall biosynthesis
MRRTEKPEKKLKILTWHIHGSYLYYLTQTPCEFYLPVKDGKEPGYGGRATGFPWTDNVYNVPAEKVKEIEFDCILFQSAKNYLEDQYEILSPEQRKLSKIYLEHDPPREVPTDTKHVMDDSDALLVHVTDFNNIMWDNNSTPSAVIRHGVIVNKNVQYTGELEKGIVVINGLAKRGRRLGLDIFEKVRKEIPLDIFGLGSEEVGGLGEVPITELHALMSRYRFFFNPIRYTSMGLAVCEAMMTGMPIVGLATTEMAVSIRNGVTGYIHTNPAYLIKKMKALLANPEAAMKLGKKAKAAAEKKFNIERFTDDWLKIFHYAINRKDRKTEDNLDRKVGGLK